MNLRLGLGGDSWFGEVVCRVLVWVGESRVVGLDYLEKCFVLLFYFMEILGRRAGTLECIRFRG